MSPDTTVLVIDACRRARAAARALAAAPASSRSAALLATAQGLAAHRERLLDANARDVEAARAAGQTSAFLDRLLLTTSRIDEMALSLSAVAQLPDPLGEVERAWTRPNGLEISQVRVPLGVVAIVYEARPNVTTEAGSLVVKAGNACLLKGGSDAVHSTRLLVEIMREALTASALPADAVQAVEPPTREAVAALLDQDELVDVVIPRGGEGLVRAVVEQSRIPVIKQYKGVCHTYVDDGADIDQAVRIAVNAKAQRPATCNAMETLLVHAAIAPEVLPAMHGAMTEARVSLRGCPRTCRILPGVQPATDEDWATEYLDLTLSVKVVDSLDEAMAHIARYGTGHSEAILTRDRDRAERFLREVDAACVYVNASTRFTDGYQFGLGAEVGISTGKLHSRGPMGLRDLTCLKYVIRGSGQVRE